MTRLTLNDTYEDAIKKISQEPGSTGYNPGAASVIMQCYQKDFFIGQLVLVALDEKGIYGSNVWIEYKDKNGEDLDKFIDALDPTLRKRAEALKMMFDSDNEKKEIDHDSKKR